MTDVARALVLAYANLLTPGISTNWDAGPDPAGPIPAPFDGLYDNLLPAPAAAKAPGKEQLAVALALAGDDWHDPIINLSDLDNWSV